MLSLQGCMSTDVVPKGPIFTYNGKPADQESIAYFYQFDMPLVNSCLLVGIDDKYRGCIGYPGYVHAIISAGNHEVSFTPNAPIKISNLDFKFDFEAGKEYFFVYKLSAQKSANDIEVKAQYNMLLDATYGWYLVEKQEALSALQGLRAWQ
jgi:hypothetical protein